MAKEVRLSRPGDTVEECIVVESRVQTGDEVRKGDVIFEVETDKVTLEVESPFGGFVKDVLVEPEQAVPVGGTLLVLGEKEENVATSFIEELRTENGRLIEKSKRKAAQAEQKTTDGPAGASGSSQKSKKGNFAGRKIKRMDEELELGDVVKVNKLQRLTAERMVESKRQKPCFYLNVEADVTELVELRGELNAGADVQLTYNDFLIKAVGEGLVHYPVMTGRLVGDEMQLAKEINVALAVSSAKGLVAPVIKDVPGKNIREIATEKQSLIDKANEDKLTLGDLQGGCITVSNLGAFGVDSFIPIVIPGQCSILGAGRISDAIVPDRDEAAVRKIMELNLSVDHKIANGAQASQFLDFVKRMLEEKETFLER